MAMHDRFSVGGRIALAVVSALGQMNFAQEQLG